MLKANNSYLGLWTGAAPGYLAVLHACIGCSGFPVVQPRRLSWGHIAASAGCQRRYYRHCHLPPGDPNSCGQQQDEKAGTRARLESDQNLVRKWKTRTSACAIRSCFLSNCANTGKKMCALIDRTIFFRSQLHEGIDNLTCLYFLPKLANQHGCGIFIYLRHMCNRHARNARM